MPNYLNFIRHFHPFQEKRFHKILLFSTSDQICITCSYFSQDVQSFKSLIKETIGLDKIVIKKLNFNMATPNSSVYSRGQHFMRNI